MSVWRVEFKSSAAREFRKLPQDAQAKIRATLRRYAETGVGDVRHLTGRSDELRLRAGDYRVIFERQGDCLVILVLAVGNRRDVYRD